VTEEQISDASAAAASEAQEQLNAIAENVIKKHGLSAINLTPDELCRVGLTLNDMQGESFNLGVRVGIKLVITLLQQQDSECESA
jgi:hypothetical protein